MQTPQETVAFFLRVGHRQVEAWLRNAEVMPGTGNFPVMPIHPSSTALRHPPLHARKPGYPAGNQEQVHHHNAPQPPPFHPNGAPTPWSYRKAQTSIEYLNSRPTPVLDNLLDCQYLILRIGFIPETDISIIKIMPYQMRDIYSTNA